MIRYSVWPSYARNSVAWKKDLNFFGTGLVSMLVKVAG
jgi:hypothetical protein